MSLANENIPMHQECFFWHISHATLEASFKCYHILANLLPNHLYFVLPIVMCHLVSIKMVMIMHGNAQPLRMGTAQPLCMGTAQPLRMGTAQPLRMGTTQPLRMGTAQPLRMGTARMK